MSKHEFHLTNSLITRNNNGAWCLKIHWNILLFVYSWDTQQEDETHNFKKIEQTRCVKKNNAHPKIHSSLQAKSYEDGDQRQTERIPANEPKSGKW